MIYFFPPLCVHYTQLFILCGISLLEIWMILFFFLLFFSFSISYAFLLFLHWGGSLRVFPHSTFVDFQLLICRCVELVKLGSGNISA